MTVHVRTEIENILRVKMYAPRGFCLPHFSMSNDISNHPANRSINRIEMADDRIYYVMEFEDIALDQQKSIRKFCRDSMKKIMVSIEEYHAQKRLFEDYLARVRDNNRRIRAGERIR